MPARTNEFQKIVYLITKHAATGGATVTESQSLYDKAAGIDREVDVVKRSADGKSTIIGIECTNLGEKADVKWVDEMLGKHRDLPTDVLILYSGKGFSEAAMQKAAYYQKTIIAMESLDEADAERLFGGASVLWFRQLKLAVTEVLAKVAVGAGRPEEQLSVLPDFALFSPLQEPIDITKPDTQWSRQAALDYVMWFVRRPEVNLELLKNCNETHKGFMVGAAPPTDFLGRSLFVLKEDVTPKDMRRIKVMEVMGTVEFSNSPVPVKHGRLGVDTVAWGTIDVGEKRLIVVGSKRTNQEMKVSFDAFKAPIKGRTRRPRRTGKRMPTGKRKQKSKS